MAVELPLWGDLIACEYGMQALLLVWGSYIVSGNVSLPAYFLDHTNCNATSLHTPMRTPLCNHFRCGRIVQRGR